MAEQDTSSYDGYVPNKKNDTMHDAILDLKAYGYNLSQIVNKSDEDVVWNQKDNRFYLTSDIPTGVKNYELWHIQNDVSSQAYSIYAGEKFATADVVLNAVGFDAGDNATISSVKYNGSSAGQTVKVRTASGTLEVDAEKDSLYHYGEAGLVNIINIDVHSYHEAGIVHGFITIENGNIEFDTKGEYMLKVESTDVTASNNGGATITVYASEDLNENNFDGIDVDETSVQDAAALNEIKTYAELVTAIGKVNSGALDNPVLVLSALEYDFEARIEINKSVTIKGVPGVTKLNGYPNPNGIGTAGAFYAHPSTAAQEMNFLNLKFNCFGVYSNAAKTILCGPNVFSNTGIFCEGLEDSKFNIDSCEFLGLGGTTVKLSGGIVNVSNSLFDGTIQNSESGNLIQAGNTSASAINSVITVENCVLKNATMLAGAAYGPSGMYIFGKASATIKNTQFENCLDPIFAYQWGYNGPRPTLAVQKVSFENCQDDPIYDYRFYKQTSELEGGVSTYTLDDGDYYKEVTNEYGDTVIIYYEKA